MRLERCCEVVVKVDYAGIVMVLEGLWEWFRRLKGR